MKRLALKLCAVLAAAAILAPLQASAQSGAQPYPSRPIKLILGFAAGGPTDVIARTFAQRLSGQLGVPVTVDNRSGADSLLASQAVKNAEPDGYTIYMASSAHAINPSLFKNAQFDAIKDFTPISMVGDVPNLIVVNPGLPVKTLAEFVAYAKARKGQLNYGTTASVTFLATELMARSAGIELQRIPYKGASPASTALMAGDVQLMVTGIGPMLPLVKAGKLRALAITSEKRSLLAPEVPTAVEAGLPGYTSSVWYALLAPANLPRPIAERLAAETRAALSNPEVSAALTAQGVEVRSSSPDELEKYMRSEVTKWQKVVQDTGAQQTN